ncbi:MAG: adenylate/guanylate cyclase domain-containing protein, partial [Bdellovibrionales bacterium]|nr:adenylate/guanylate cyclase domain-containing protein [Bdellovibrionales bacterium]
PLLLEKYEKVLLQQEERIEEYDTEYTDSAGEPISLNLTIEPLTDAQSEKSIGAVGILEDITSEKRQRTMISRFLSKDIAERFFEGDWESLMKGTKKDVTLLFCDIRNFTSIAEKMEPGDLVELLNEYFTYMVDEIFACGGTLDKYVGDAIVAIFGAPVTDPNNALHAVEAALSMKRALRTFNSTRSKNGLFEIKFGIGISTGKVLCGTIGSEKRLEYTSIGDDVNLASRLEGANKVYGTELLISEFTYELVKDQVRCRELDRVKLKGKENPVTVYELVGKSNDVFGESFERGIAQYAQGHSEIRKREFGLAAEHFLSALKLLPEDKACQLWIGRCEQFLKEPPGEDWDGSFEFTEK